MEVETEGVRVLTVHASKGLEAPIVFLPDSCGGPDSRHEPKLMRLSPAKAGRSAGLRLGQEVGRGRRRGRRRAGRGARGSGGRAPAPALCRHDPGGPAPHCRRLRDLEAPSGRLLVRSHPCGPRRRARRSAGARSAADETILRFGEGLRAEDRWRNGARVAPSTPCPAGSSPRRRPRHRRASPQPFARRRRRRGRPGTGARGAARARSARDAAQPPARAPPGRGDGLSRGARAARSPNQRARRSPPRSLAAIGAPELSRLFGPGARGEVPLAGLLPRPGRARPAL